VNVAALPLLLLSLGLPLQARAQQPFERLFYYVDTEDAWQSLSRHIDQVSIVAPEAFKVDSEGVVWGEVDPRVVQLAHAHHVHIVPLLQNPGFDQAMLHHLLADSVAVSRTLTTLVELCQDDGFAGIQLDFENVSIEDRGRYTSFARRAADRLHEAGRSLSLAVVHRGGDLPGPTRYHAWLFENWRAGYDLDALGRIADFISVMTYSQHTRRTPPGPQASIPWDEQVITYFLKHVPADKLSLGIPTGSQHWYTSQENRITPESARSYSEGISYQRAMALVQRNGAHLQWNDQAQVPFAYFSRGGTWEWIFLENARSFRAKLALAKRLHLRGISVWVLGNEDPAIWNALPAVRATVLHR
jgi:spore germination protein YaaH